MERIMLNSMRLNDAVKELTINARNDVHKRYAVECDNCILSIWTAAHAMDEQQIGHYVEVALLDKDYEYIHVYPRYYTEEEREQYGWDKEMSEIPYMPIMGIPLMINTFRHLEKDNMEDIWNAFYDISYEYSPV